MLHCTAPPFHRLVLLGATLLASGCGGSLEEALFGPARQEDDLLACSPLPENGSPDTAEVMEVGTPYHTRLCPIEGPNNGWWKMEGQFEDGQRFRLNVAFDRGRDAEDIDFDIGRRSGNSVSSRHINGSCTNPPGQDENCLVELEMQDPVTELYVVGRSLGFAERETFVISVTSVANPNNP